MNVDAFFFKLCDVHKASGWEAPFNVFGVRVETDPYEVVATIRIQIRTCP